MSNRVNKVEESPASPGESSRNEKMKKKGRFRNTNDEDAVESSRITLLTLRNMSSQASPVASVVDATGYFNFCLIGTHVKS